MRKVILAFSIFILVINVIYPIYADDELEEGSITEQELHEIIETATNAMNVPVINSRHAIIYDRVSRHRVIWKRRE